MRPLFSQSLSGFRPEAATELAWAAQRGNNAQDFDIYLDSTLLGTFVRQAVHHSFYECIHDHSGFTHAEVCGARFSGGDNTAFIDNAGDCVVGKDQLREQGYRISSQQLHRDSSATHNPFTNSSFSTSTSAFSGAQDGNALNNKPYVTQYSYDALGNLTCVVQKGSDTTAFTTCAAAPAAWRPRSFTYDSLSRLLTATNPESGTITYSYDPVGNVLQKTSPAANQTGTARTTLSFCYDELNRPTGKAYSAQTCQNGRLPAGTAVVNYTYDVGTNTIGYLSSDDQAGSASILMMH